MTWVMHTEDDDDHCGRCTQAYVQRLYRTPEIGASINMRHIKVHYFTSHPRLNYYAIVPAGGDAWWE